MYVGFGFISGLQTQGYKACSTCGPNMSSIARYCPSLHKLVYLGHTMFLPMGHDMRADPFLYADYDSIIDTREQPEPTNFSYWRSLNDRVCDPEDALTYGSGSGLTRWTILATLPYWHELKIRHLLDPMHIEGNVGKSLIAHLYGEREKNFREACQEMERHPDVWVVVDPVTQEEVNPQAPWVFTRAQKREFCQRIGDMKFLTGYGANLRKAFGMEESEKWPRYLKTHDYHRLLQHVLPVAIIGLGSEELEDAIWSLGKLLRWVCAKEIHEVEIPTMKILAAEVVCKLEKALPPSFFDCQVHLLVHLVEEVAIAGPVHCRWMYWLEQYMSVL